MVIVRRLGAAGRRPTIGPSKKSSLRAHGRGAHDAHDHQARTRVAPPCRSAVMSEFQHWPAAWSWTCTGAKERSGTVASAAALLRALA